MSILSAVRFGSKAQCIYFTNKQEKLSINADMLIKHSKALLLVKLLAVGNLAALVAYFVYALV